MAAERKPELEKRGRRIAMFCVAVCTLNRVAFALAVPGPEQVSAKPAPTPVLEMPQQQSSNTSGSLQSEPKFALSLPLLLFLYTSQTQLGSIAAVKSLAVGVAAEIPRWVGSATSFAVRWRGGFEHHASFQNRWYLGVAPVFEVAPACCVSLELGLNVSAVLLRSLWHPFHFDADSATWHAGEGHLKLAAELGLQGALWLKPDLPFRIGAFYGFSVLYPVSPENDLPFLPLTKLGIAAGWTLGS